MTPPLSPSRPPDTGVTSPTLSPNPNPSSTPADIASQSLSKKHSKRDSRVSVATNSSVKSHKEYLDSLVTPTHEMVERISSVQEQKEVETIRRRLSEDHGELSSEERERAANLIQRNYRGHRERRMLAGMSLDPSTRWTEAIKEARYRNLTQPRARESTDAPRTSVDSIVMNGTALDGAGADPRSSAARRNWKKIGLIARRAGGDEDSDEDDESDGDEHLTAEEREKQRKRRYEQKLERQKAAKMMGR